MCYYGAAQARRSEGQRPGVRLVPPHPARSARYAELRAELVPTLVGVAARAERVGAAEGAASPGGAQAR